MKKKKTLASTGKSTINWKTYLLYERRRRRCRHQQKQNEEKLCLPLVVEKQRTMNVYELTSIAFFSVQFCKISI